MKGLFHLHGNDVGHNSHDGVTKATCHLTWLPQPTTWQLSGLTDHDRAMANGTTTGPFKTMFKTNQLTMNFSKCISK